MKKTFIIFYFALFSATLLSAQTFADEFRSVIEEMISGSRAELKKVERQLATQGVNVKIDLQYSKQSNQIIYKYEWFSEEAYNSVNLDVASCVGAITQYFDTKPSGKTLDWFQRGLIETKTSIVYIYKYKDKQRNKKLSTDEILKYTIVYTKNNIDDISLNIIRRVAENNHAFSQYVLGCYYNDGKRVNKDINKAKYWYERALSNGYELAKIHLACIYEEEKDYNKSYSLWFSYANNKKNEDSTSVNNTYNLSLFKVAFYKEQGLGTSIDIHGAIEYGERAYNNGYVSVLGVLYACYSVLKDANNCFITAQRINEKLGNSFRLAYHYLYGEGCEQSLDKVYGLLTDTAMGKLIIQSPDGTTITMDPKRQYEAMLYIGVAYYFDKKNPSHYEEAVKWLNQVNESNVSTDKSKGEAACLLSRCYRFGRGVRQDITKANELEKEAKRLLSEEDYNKFSKHFQASY